MDIAPAISDVAVANFAAGILDDRSITSLSDDTSIGRFMQREYTYARDELLQSYPWSFAKKRALLPALTAAPAFGYQYAYRVPTDCLRPLPLTVDGHEESDPVPYEYESFEILCDLSAPLKLRYIRRVTNASEFTHLYARALGCKLAMMAATRITGKSAYFEKAAQMYAAAMADAKLEDSLSRGTPSRYISADGTAGISVLGVRGF